MSDLLVSIIESIAGSFAAARERQVAQAQAAAPGQPPPIPAGTRAKPSVPMGRIAPRPTPAIPVRPAAPAAPEAAPGRALDVGAMFATSDRLLQTVIAAEILGPPIAARRQNLWDVPGV